MTNYSRIPEHMRDGVRAYIEHGRQPGGFLRAVLENDLKGAAAQADAINVHHLYDWAVFIVNEMPALSQGSPDRVDAWIKHIGFRGLDNA